MFDRTIVRMYCAFYKCVVACVFLSGCLDIVAPLTWTRTQPKRTERPFRWQNHPTWPVKSRNTRKKCRHRLLKCLPSDIRFNVERIYTEFVFFVSALRSYHFSLSLIVHRSHNDSVDSCFSGGSFFTQPNYCVFFVVVVGVWGVCMFQIQNTCFTWIDFYAAVEFIVAKTNGQDRFHSSWLSRADTRDQILWSRGRFIYLPKWPDETLSNMHIMVFRWFDTHTRSRCFRYENTQFFFSFPSCVLNVFLLVRVIYSVLIRSKSNIINFMFVLSISLPFYLAFSGWIMASQKTVE